MWWPLWPLPGRREPKPMWSYEMRSDTPPQRLSKCGGGSVYEPGVTHEHTCIASGPHGKLDHTCECGYTWEDIAWGGEAA